MKILNLFFAHSFLNSKIKRNHFPYPTQIKLLILYNFFNFYHMFLSMMVKIKFQKLKKISDFKILFWLSNLRRIFFYNLYPLNGKIKYFAGYKYLPNNSFVKILQYLEFFRIVFIMILKKQFQLIKIIFFTHTHLDSAIRGDHFPHFINVYDLLYVTCKTKRNMVHFCY